MMTKESLSSSEVVVRDYEKASNEQLAYEIAQIDGFFRYGQASPDIKPIQAVLKRMGLYPYAIDGEWGNGTNKGFKALQSKLGTTPDGVFGPDSRQKLVDFLKSQGEEELKLIADKFEKQRETVKEVRKEEKKEKKRESKKYKEIIETIPDTQLGKKIAMLATEACKKGDELGAAHCSAWVENAMKLAGAKDKYPHLYRGSIRQEAGGKLRPNKIAKQADIDKLYPGCHLMVDNANSATSLHSVVVTEVLGDNKFKVVCRGGKNNVYETVYNLNTTGEVDRKTNSFPMVRAYEPQIA